MADNSEYNQRVNAYYTPNQSFITAEEVLTEIELRCSSGQQYTTFPNQITDEEKALIEAKNYIVTRNYIDSENRDGAEPEKLYIGFQVALTEDATDNALIISQAETNGVGEGGGGSATLIKKTITSNGTYKASSDNADGYSKVTVDVPNTYTAQDEGMVVDNGALVPQTTMPSEITENGTVDTTLFNSVTVNVPSSGGGGSAPNAVNFYDYDGTIVQSYSAADFANLSELPANPTHEGLTAQGWNWSLSDAKTYVATYGSLNIGQMYVTNDGKTRIYINLPEGRISPVLQLYLDADSELDIDWGDGSTHSTFTSTNIDYKSERHNYPDKGNYVIAITVVSGSFVLQSSSTTVSSILWNGNDSGSSLDRTYNNAIKKIEIGNNVPSIGQYTFFTCYSLSSITIPDGVTTIGSYAFQYCYSLSSITLPSTLTSIGSSVFQSCYSLSSITIPDSVTSISQYAFQNCYSLSSVTIPDSVTSIGNSAFSSCYALSSITIPDTVTSIGNNTFYYCVSLSSVTIPDTVTSIGNAAFYNCYALLSITIPDRVTSIGNNAFYGCSFMDYIKFIPTTPPTVQSSSAWTSVSTSTRILVPINTYGAYITKTNYPRSSTYKYFVYGTYASGDPLPTTTTDNYTLTWYASMDDAASQTNPISVGNGNEVYARCS